MKSNYQNPILFFERFLDIDIQSELIKFYQSSEELLSTSPYDNIDKSSHIIQTYDAMTDKVISYTFEDYLKPLIQIELQNSKNLIDHEFQKRFSNPSEVLGFSNWLSVKLNSLRKYPSTKTFPFTSGIIDSLFEHIEIYVATVTTKTNIYSFNILPNANESQISKIERLYLLLNESPALINSEREEFINAFSGNEVNLGVRWLVKGKNKKTSKVSLFYFISQLIDNSHLERYIITEQSRYISKVFKDSEGNELRNLKQSKSTMSSSPAQAERIDNIINQL